jgi:hypothetical protein
VSRHTQTNIILNLISSSFLILGLLRDSLIFWLIIAAFSLTPRYAVMARYGAFSGAAMAA